MRALSIKVLKYQVRTKDEMNYYHILFIQVKQQHQSEQHYESNITQTNHQQNSTITVNGQYQVSVIRNKAINLLGISSTCKQETN